MIALQHDRARLLLIAVERATRRARNVRLADDRLAVQHDRYSASHERDVVGLPLVRALRRILIGNEESVDRAEPTCVLRAAHYRVFDLRLVTAPQVDAAVPLGRVLELHMELEVAVRLIGDEIAAALGVREHAIDRLPLILATGHMPSCCTPAVEQLHRRAPPPTAVPTRARATARDGRSRRAACRRPW